jgi:hypothetical protein
MTNVDRSHAKRPTEFLYGLEYVMLSRYIEAGSGFVKNYHVGPTNEGNGESDSLLLAARQLMWIRSQEGRRGVELDGLKDPSHTLRHISGL